VNALSVIGEYDVVVVGGGTGGAPAAIAAGRQGVRTLIIEHLYSLGGVGTAGLISSYYFGNRVGFTKEIDLGIAKMSGNDVKTSSL
jgi:pyruvate/2-oxoglutarate dehydrogenase complex dihydrolipoamide dehydrogenase (E3) component